VISGKVPADELVDGKAGTLAADFDLLINESCCEIAVATVLSLI